MLKITKKVTLHLCDGTLVFDDAIREGAGTGVDNQLGHDIRLNDYQGKHWFINRDCVCYAETEVTSEEVEVQDDTCVKGS